MSHQIRLYSRWKVIQAGIEKHIDLPFDADTDPPVTLIRPFGKPTGLDEKSRLLLRFGEVKGRFAILLNATQLGELTDEIRGFDVTSLLKERNEIRLEMLVRGTLASVVVEIC